MSTLKIRLHMVHEIGGMDWEWLLIHVDSSFVEAIFAYMFYHVFIHYDFGVQELKGRR